MSRKGWVFFAAVSVVWGMPYLFIKIAVDEGVSPAFLSFVRVAMAAALLLLIAWRSGARCADCARRPGRSPRSRCSRSSARSR